MAYTAIRLPNGRYTAYDPTTGRYSGVECATFEAARAEAVNAQWRETQAAVSRLETRRLLGHDYDPTD